MHLGLRAGSLGKEVGLQLPGKRRTPSAARRRVERGQSGAHWPGPERHPRRTKTMAARIDTNSRRYPVRRSGSRGRLRGLRPASHTATGPAINPAITTRRSAWKITSLDLGSAKANAAIKATAIPSPAIIQPTGRSLREPVVKISRGPKGSAY